MVPSHMKSIWKDLRKKLADGRANEAASLLLTLSTSPAELVRSMQEALVEAIGHPSLAARRDELFDATIESRTGKKTRYVCNDRNQIVEVCRLDAGGKPSIPLLVLDPVRKRGQVKFRSMEDSFGGGRASAGTMYGDDPHETEMAFSAWRDGYLKWFKEN